MFNFSILVAKDKTDTLYVIIRLPRFTLKYIIQSEIHVMSHELVPTQNRLRESFCHQLAYYYFI